jgi:hypothetical protein
MSISVILPSRPDIAGADVRRRSRADHAFEEINQMTPGADPREVAACDDAFFAGLLTADVDSLRGLLAPQFLIVDVMAGQVADRETLLDALGSGGLRFADIIPSVPDRSIRSQDGTAVVVGRTRMHFYAGDEDVTIDSRYTHVFIAEGAGWLLLSAQGTPIR